jgi:hypothetical protein
MIIDGSSIAISHDEVESSASIISIASLYPSHSLDTHRSTQPRLVHPTPEVILHPECGVNTPYQTQAHTTLIKLMHIT